MFAVTGCAPGVDPRGAPATAPSTPGPTSSCPNERAVQGDEGLARPGELVGDITGTGAPDEATVRVDPEGVAGCVAFLVVEADAGALSIPLNLLGVEDPSVLEDLGLPALYGLAEMNGAPGLEVIVKTAAGASTEFLALFTAMDGRLHQMDVQGGHPDDLFGFGGSVGHLESADCGDAADITATSAIARADGYVVTRERFVVQGRVVRRIEIQKNRVSFEQLAAYPELGGPAFASCRSF